MTYDPIKLTEKVKNIVTRGILRKYYRTARPGRWYGGIATADCCGCNLRCVFCWSGEPRDHPESVGEFYSPEYIYNKLTGLASKFDYTQLRVSGNEPTLNKEHLLRLLELVDQTNYKFILETNGILIGSDSTYAKELAKYDCVEVRVSIKGTTATEFTKLTGACQKAFDLQLKALENLLNANVTCWPAVMISFSPEENFQTLVQRLSKIDRSLADNVEREYVFLYPKVVERLNAAGLTPLVAYNPNKIPRELV